MNRDSPPRAQAAFGIAGLDVESFHGASVEAQRGGADEMPRLEMEGCGRDKPGAAAH